MSSRKRSSSSTIPASISPARIAPEPIERRAGQLGRSPKREIGRPRTASKLERLAGRRLEPPHARGDPLGQALGERVAGSGRRGLRARPAALAAGRWRKAGFPVTAPRASRRAPPGPARPITASASSPEVGSIERREVQPRHQAVLVELEQHLRRDLVPSELLRPAGRDRRAGERRRGGARSSAGPPTRMRPRSERRRDTAISGASRERLPSSLAAPGAGAGPVGLARGPRRGRSRRAGTGWPGRRAARHKRRRPPHRTERLERGCERLGRQSPNAALAPSGCARPEQSRRLAAAREQFAREPALADARVAEQQHDPQLARGGPLSSSSSRARSSRRPISCGPGLRRQPPLRSVQNRPPPAGGGSRIRRACSHPHSFP